MRKPPSENHSPAAQFIELSREKDQRALLATNPALKRRLFNDAFQLAEQALHASPDSRSKLAVARVLLHQKKFKDAMRIYKQGLQKATESGKHCFLNGIGNTYRYMADHEKSAAIYYRHSIRAYQSAISLAPKGLKSLYWSNLATTYAELQGWEEAINALLRAIPLLEQEEQRGISHGDQLKILKLELALYREYEKRTL